MTAAPPEGAWVQPHDMAALQSGLRDPANDREGSESSAAPEPVVPCIPQEVRFVFLGTASMAPSQTRNVSGNAMRIGSEWWVIDAGEGTQHQINRCSVAPGSIARIFVTHLHGDHCFGLPGLMCKMNVSDEAREVGRVVQLVGPRGLRQMLRAALLATHTYTTFQWRVDELHPAPAAAAADAPATSSSSMNGAAVHFSSVFTLPAHPNEVPGADVQPDPADGSWAVPPPPVLSPASGAWRVRATFLRHTIFSVGYVFTEAPHRGAVDAKAAKAILMTDENKAWQKEHRNLKNPMALLGKLQKGEAVEVLVNGAVTYVQPSHVVSAAKPGRVVAVMGDTSDSSSAAPFVVGADLLVHEATNAALTDAKGNAEDEAAVTARTLGHGHSTPRMAGAFARACAVRTLALTHFSSRYKGDTTPESVEVMGRIVHQAAVDFKPEEAAAVAAPTTSTEHEAQQHQRQEPSPLSCKLDTGGSVFAARDLLEVEVPVKRPELAALPTPAEALRRAVNATAVFDRLAMSRQETQTAAARTHKPPGPPAVGAAEDRAA